MWGKIIIPMYRLWLHGLYGLYGPWCPLSAKSLINLISLSLSLPLVMLLTGDNLGGILFETFLNFFYSKLCFSKTYYWSCHTCHQNSWAIWRYVDPELWPWPWIFKIQFWKKKHIPGKGGPIDIEWKDSESIGCWTHCVTVTWPLTLPHYLGLGSLRLHFQIGISQEGQLTWNKRNVSPIWCWAHYATLDLQCGLSCGLQHIPNTLAKLWVDAKLLQLPTRGPINGLSIIWSMGWGVLSFSVCFFEWVFQNDYIFHPVG